MLRLHGLIIRGLDPLEVDRWRGFVEEFRRLLNSHKLKVELSRKARERLAELSGKDTVNRR